MKSHDVSEALRGLRELRVTRNTTEEEATAAVCALGELDGCMLGVTRFSGLTPWEHHPDHDELLYVVEGGVEVTVLAPDGTVTRSVPAGSVFVVPRGVWHRQRSDTGAALLFIVGATDISWSEDPRNDAG